MKAKRCMAVLVVMAGLMLVGTGAWGACLQGNLAGTWNLYVGGADNVGLFWQRCIVRFGPTGAITSGSCVDDNGVAGTLSGKLVMGATPVTNCVFTGTLTFISGLRQLAVSVRHATMNIDRNVFSGVGGANNGSAFLFTGVKK